MSTPVRTPMIRPRLTGQGKEKKEVMEILLKRSRSAGSEKRGIIVAVVLIYVNTVGEKTIRMMAAG